VGAEPGSDLLTQVQRVPLPISIVRDRTGAELREEEAQRVRTAVAVDADPLLVARQHVHVTQAEGHGVLVDALAQTARALVLAERAADGEKKLLIVESSALLQCELSGDQLVEGAGRRRTTASKYRLLPHGI